MAKQIITKGIADNAVTDEKILLRNDTWLRARNAADTADLNLIGVNLLDETVSYNSFLPRVGTDSVVSNYIDNSSASPVAADVLLTLDTAFTGQEEFGSYQIASAFTPVYDGDVQTIYIYLSDVGVSAGDLFVNIYADNSGEPGVLLGTSDLVSRGTISSPGLYAFTFTTPVAILGGQMHWASLEGDSVYVSSASTVSLGRRDADFGDHPVKWYDGALWQDPVNAYSVRFQVYGEQQVTAFIDLGKLTAPWDNAFLNELRLTDDDNTNYVGFKAPSVVASDQIWILPDADGTAGQALVTDGAGNLSWDTVTTAPSGAAGSIQFSDGSAFASDNANLFWNDSTNKLGIRNNTPQGVLDVVHGGSGQGIYFLTGHTSGDTGIAIENGANIQGTNGNLSAPVNLTLQPGGGNVILTTGSNHLPGSSGGSALGTSALRWNAFMASTNTSSLQVGHSGVTGAIAMVNTSGSTYGNILVNAATPSASTAGLLVRAETALPLGLATSATVSIASGDILIESGNATNGNTGSIQLRPGIVSGTGTRGSIVAHTTLRPNGGSINLGVNNTTDTWTNIYGQNLFAGGIGSGLGTLSIRNASALVGALHSLDTTTISGKTVGYRIRSQRVATLGPIGIDTDSTATFGIGTGAIYIETGDKTNGGAGASGDIWFKTGTSAADSGHVVLETGTATGVRGKVKFQDGSQGTVGHIWTQTAADGSGAWQAAAGAGANTSLSNLIATAINQDLVWAGGVTWRLKTADNAAASTANLEVSSGALTGAGAGTNTGNVSVLTGSVTEAGDWSGNATFGSGIADSGGSGNVLLTSGNCTGSGPSGNVSVQTGTTSGTRGQINLLASQINVNSNIIWTSGVAGLLATLNVGSGATQAITVRAGDSGGGGNGGAILLRSGSSSGSTDTGAATFQSANHSGVGSGSSGAVLIASGNPGSSGSSGGITLRTGSGGSSRGSIFLDETSLGAASNGYVWTLADQSTGRGAWVAASGGAGTQRVEYRTITGGEAAADQLTLAFTPLTPTLVQADIFDGGGPMEYTAEFTVTGTTFDWSGGPYSGVFVAGDRIRIVYWS